MTTKSMTYNGLDTRVGMTDSTGSRTFRRAGIGVTSPVLSDGSASFTPSGENRAGVKTAYHGGLKSFDTQTNSAQAVVGQRLTDAFGNQISSSGVWKGRFAYGGPYGYQEDPDTGLRLLGHRYYDSSAGRFLTRDPIKDGRNWYVYCGSNPVTGVDPTGLKFHHPTQVEVDPEFDGKVWVTGETKTDPDDFSTVFLPGGFKSNPNMDVDYVTIVFPDGRTVRFFIPGSAQVSARYKVDKNGNLVLLYPKNLVIPFRGPNGTTGFIPNPAYPFLGPKRFSPELEFVPNIEPYGDELDRGLYGTLSAWSDRIKRGHANQNEDAKPIPKAG